MKPKAKDPTSVKSQGIQNSVNFGIKQSGLHHILGILRDQLYSDKILAVVREYTCNAVDAQVEAGNGDKPIEVTLPNRLNPYFKVRDYGTALSDQEINDVYAFYGESTKRNSNDQIGMLGIGSKSAFAYGDNFVINSFLNGEKHSYNAFIDPSQLGQISKLSVESTDEENGIEIVVPVRDGDEDEFVEKAATLFQWFQVRPIIKGAELEYEDKGNALFSGEGWTWTDAKNERYGRNGDAYAIMGNIGYPIDEDSVGFKTDAEHELRELLKQNLVLHFDIGDLEISASREKLQYTDHTRKAIVKRLKKVQDELAETILKDFTNCETLFAAKCLYGEIFDYGSGLYALRNVLSKKLVWNGKLVSGETFQAVEDMEIHVLKKNSYQTRYKYDDSYNISCAKNVVVVENDMGHRRGSMGKLLPFAHTEGKKVYLVSYKTPKAKKKFIDEQKFDAKVKMISKLEQHPLSEFGMGSTSSSSSGSYVKNAKHSAKCFEFDFTGAKDLRSYHSPKSDFWKVAELDVENESGVYVIIDKFQVERKENGSYSNWVCPHNLKQLKEVIEQSGIDFPKNVYAFKLAQRDKIEGKDGWVELHTWAKAQIEDVIESGNLHQAWRDIQEIDSLHQWNPDSDRYYRGETKEQVNSIKKLNLAVADGSLGKFLEKYNAMTGSEKTFKQIKAIQAVASEYQVEFSCPKSIKPTHDIKKEFKSVLEKYEMLTLMSSNSWSYNFDSKVKAKVENYIKVIDLCGK